jgi:hypothetical protein
MKAVHAAATIGAVVFISGCFRVSPDPPDTTKDYTYVASLSTAESADFYRFDLPPSSPVWNGIKLGYGRPTVIDHDGKVMRCGPFGIDAETLARPTITSLPLTRLGKPDFPCDRNTADYGRCVQTHPQGTALYEVHFDVTPDARKQPYPHLRLHWNHSPTQGGFIYELDDDGRITAQILLSRIGREPAGDTQEERLAVIIHKPVLRLLTDTKDQGLDLQAVDLVAREKRGDVGSYWFEAAGTPPYRLFFDWKRAHCQARLDPDESPPRIGDVNWPPTVVVGASRLVDRNLLDEFKGNLDHGWWVLLEIFFPAWIAAIILAFVYRFTNRRGR